MQGDLHLHLPDRLPRVLWIELTSKCPFDCSFCSRKLERGTGEHMSFDLYRSVIVQLERPEIIRLNYSGESLHYPRLEEAIRLARDTGATSELVTALGSAPQSAIKAVVDGGLHRLSISLHTLDPTRYRSIYGRGCVSDVQSRLDYLRTCRTLRGSRYPEIDFAFVAMHDNLPDLRAVAGYASALHVKQLSVHPAIRRSAIPTLFGDELAHNGDLRPDFAFRMAEEVRVAGSLYPDLAITVARPVGEPETAAGGGITTCSQNPWNTMHILADGRVVPCEVQDKTVLGNLRHQTLDEIWNGAQYREFRRGYLDGSNPACRRCPWRTTTARASGQPALVRGWHPSTGDSVQWSELSAALALTTSPAVQGVTIKGLLPPGAGEFNSLSIATDQARQTTVLNNTSELLPFEVSLSLPRRPDLASTIIAFNTREPFCPAERGAGPDLRRLGFALTDLSLVANQDRSRKVKSVISLLEQVERVSRWRRLRPPWRIPQEKHPGLSIVVPARGTSNGLAHTLDAAEEALKPVTEPAEILVVMSETDGSHCDSLLRRFPQVRWIFRTQPLQYAAAVTLGLRFAKYSWIYLLNSDMRLESNAIASVLALRGEQTFAVGSRIVMEDGTATETNWTDLQRCERDAAIIVERNPDDLQNARGCLYAGGGSGLFRRSLLWRSIKTTGVYAPFYWEDVEWGARAWLQGYESVFCPWSQATHAYRQTIRRYYSDAEISRIFERNRLLFHMRNLPDVHCLEQRLLTLDEQTWAEVFSPAVLSRIFGARIQAFLSPQPPDVLYDCCNLSLKRS